LPHVVFLHHTYIPYIQGDKYAAFLHDAVILYAIALNETFRKGQDVNSGVVVARNCRGKTFRGLQLIIIYYYRNTAISYYKYLYTVTVAVFISVCIHF